MITVKELLEKLQREEFCEPNCFGCCGDGKIDLTCKTVVKNFETELLKHYKPRYIKQYDPNYGDNKLCKCGHTYYRHFDTYEDMYPVGCKYCGCYEFIPREEE